MGNKRLTNTLITKLPPASASIIRSAKLINFVRFHNSENVKIRKCWSSINQYFPYQSKKRMGGLGWFRRDAVWGVWNESGTTSYRFPPIRNGGTPSEANASEWRDGDVAVPQSKTYWLRSVLFSPLLWVDFTTAHSLSTCIAVHGTRQW